MVRKQTQFERRLRLFEVLAFCILVVLVARLWQLQIVRGDYYRARSAQNRTALLPISAPRGAILDRNGQVLASNRMAYTISAVPQEFRDREAVIERLASVLEMPAEEISKKIAGQTEGRYGIPYQPARLVEDASPELVVKVAERRVELPGVIIEEEPYRSYPMGLLAGPILGYVGQISAEELKELASDGYKGRDRIGKSGIEREFERYLRGQDGVTEVEIDSLARPVGTVGIKEPIEGSTVTLTVDARVQRAAEDALRAQLAAIRAEGRYRQAQAGAVVAIDPRSGEIIAMATEPGYDPGWFVPRISDERWRQLSSGVSGLFNRAVSGAYPPGSTFKPFTAVAAIEAGLVSLSEKFLCSPEVASRYYGKKCSVWDYGRSHGYQTLHEGIANSCNIVFYELGRRLSVDLMAQAAREFGFASPTGLKFLPREVAGSVPDSSSRSFTAGERLNYAIGQGITSTPLQMAVAYGGIAMKGTMYEPTLVRQVSAGGEVTFTSTPKVARTVDLPESTWSFLHRSMVDTTRVGTAAAAFAGFPVTVAGKTGTAQAPPGDPHAWFAGWAPSSNPEIVVAVLVEQGGGGGSAAAPVARAVMEAYFGLGAGFDGSRLAANPERPE
ncbi:MAG: penicillin-binding protein 2 [Firmicutes bacterium]|jgi:penicillin-binding protein 2|nr:penicillin-binding protein 2 [Bacillota bacterium]